MIYITNMTSLTSLILFHVIIELPRIFMAMINMFKIKLINATDNCLPNIFSVKNFVYQPNYLFTYPILIWSRPKV